MTLSGNLRKNGTPVRIKNRFWENIKIGPLIAMKIYVVLFVAALAYVYQVYESFLAMAGFAAILVLFLRFPGAEKAGIRGVEICARNIYIVTLVAAILIVVL